MSTKWIKTEGYGGFSKIRGPLGSEAQPRTVEMDLLINFFQSFRFIQAYQLLSPIQLLNLFLLKLQISKDYYNI